MADEGFWAGVARNFEDYLMGVDEEPPRAAAPTPTTAQDTGEREIGDAIGGGIGGQSNGSTASGSTGTGTTPTPPATGGMTLDQMARDIYEDAKGLPGRQRARMDPALEQVTEGYDAQRALIQRRMDAAEAHQARTDQMYTDATKQRDRMMRAQEATHQIRERARIKARQDIALVNQKIESFEVDPNGAFPTLGGKIMAAISIAVGAFAQGLSGNQVPNTALKIITDAANRDIAAQKMRLGALRSTVQNKNNLYGMLLNEHGNADRAENLAMSGALQFANLQIQKVMNQYKGGAQAQALQQLLAGVNGEQQKTNLKHIDSLSRADATAIKARIDSARLLKRGGGGGAGGGTTEIFGKITQRLNDLQEVSDAVAADEKSDLHSLYRWGRGLLVKAGVSYPTEEFMTENEIKFGQGVILVAQQLMKSFQGSKPSDRDWAVFIDRFPDLRLSAEKRTFKIRGMVTWIEDRSSEGLLKPGSVAQQFGTSRKISQAEIDRFKKRFNVTSIEDDRLANRPAGSGN